MRPSSTRRAAFVVGTLCALFLVASFMFRAELAGAVQQDRRLDRDRPGSETRVALVIGNGAYEKGALKNPPNDARAMAETLREIGFETAEVIDADRERIQIAIRDFGKRLKQTGGVGLFYYAGHGVQVGGRNYLIPLGAEKKVEAEADVEIFCIDAEAVLRQMEDAGGRINIVILDACRDNPFDRGFQRSSGGGLAEIKAPSGTLIAYATDPGRTASDGDGENGLYTQELLIRMRQPGLRIEDVFNLAGEAVERKSGRKQQPWISSKLRGAFYFRPPIESATGSADPAAAEREAWEAARNSTDPEVFREFLKNFPNGVHAGTARVKLKTLESGGRPPVSDGGGTASNPKPVPPAKPAPGTQMKGAAGIELVLIPAGEFRMGTADADLDATVQLARRMLPVVDQRFFSQERPDHRVVMTRPFWMGKYEVTQAQWEAVMGTNPSHFKGCPQCPVETVNWDECQEFIRKLNAKGDGYVYALPTEAQWEYACRAGTTTLFSFGASITTEQVNFNDKLTGNTAKDACREKTLPVGTLNQPNAWGLHDMCGNVNEWCADWFGREFYRESPVNDPRGPEKGTSRILRGGSWSGSMDGCRSASRGAYPPAGRSNNVGLRVVARPVNP